jgi:hypothetical protein
MTVLNFAGASPTLADALIFSTMSELMRHQQVSVPLPAALQAFVEREAEREDRSLASVVRRCVTAARVQADRDRAGGNQAATGG